ncbi:SDR family NAD(P)-dependent oxidoreductase [Paraburkholderia sp. GAS32]|uniref:SDR family NAD(P)-dependent oxidoreductase n=1 Tax=Paraburkholderia sp. GAS32 TaxID=3035129 RepID=UPI003D2128F6
MDKSIILIVGALTSIGHATALAFVDSGARLVVSGRREAEGKAFEAELRERRLDATFIRADVRHDDDARNLIDQTVSRFGRIDAAINNASTEGQPGLMVEQTAESYAVTFDTMLGTLLSMKHELRAMQPLKRGSIVNVSSTYVHEGAAHTSVYVGSKHAVDGMTKSAALEGAAMGVRVNAVAPGPTDTGMLDRFTGTAERKALLVSTLPPSRIGKPDDVARAILFLVSDAAASVTGQIVTVDGGKTAR